MNELDKYIEKHTDSINTIGITDSINESILKEICEGYCLLKHKPETAPISDMEVINRYPNSDLNCIHEWEGYPVKFCCHCGVIKTKLHP